jgi:hypothetical protein
MQAISTRLATTATVLAGVAALAGLSVAACTPMHPIGCNRLRTSSACRTAPRS